MRPSLLGRTSVTRASGHWFLGRSLSWSITISPTLQSRWGTFHFCLVQRRGEHSRRHLNQNWLAMNCTHRHLFLEYKSTRSKFPGGGSTISVFEVSRWLGVMGSGKPGSDKISTVRVSCLSRQMEIILMYFIVSLVTWSLGLAVRSRNFKRAGDLWSTSFWTYIYHKIS